ncbi:MAG: acetyl-CoA carboxylase carboxyl transferase subunit alpha, partial [Roseimicrobium sp.]
YSVISPEGCAAILWKHRSHAPEAAEALKLSAPDLKQLGVIDDIIPETAGGAHQDHQATAANLKAAVTGALRQLQGLDTAELLQRRYAKFRAFGQFTDAS